MPDPALLRYKLLWKSRSRGKENIANFKGCFSLKPCSTLWTNILAMYISGKQGIHSIRSHINISICKHIFPDIRAAFKEEEGTWWPDSLGKKATKQRTTVQDSV